jgi:hypothetical protein
MVSSSAAGMGVEGPADDGPLPDAPAVRTLRPLGVAILRGGVEVNGLSKKPGGIDGGGLGRARSLGWVGALDALDEPPPIRGVVPGALWGRSGLPVGPYLEAYGLGTAELNWGINMPVDVRGPELYLGTHGVLALDGLLSDVLSEANALPVVVLPEANALPVSAVVVEDLCLCNCLCVGDQKLPRVIVCLAGVGAGDEVDAATGGADSTGADPTGTDSTGACSKSAGSISESSTGTESWGGDSNCDVEGVLGRDASCRGGVNSISCCSGVSMDSTTSARSSLIGSDMSGAG